MFTGVLFSHRQHTKQPLIFLKVMWHSDQIGINIGDFFFKLFLNLFPSSLKSNICFNLELLKTWSRKLQSVLKIISFLNLTHLNASALQAQTVLVVLIEVYNALDIQISFMPSICYANLQTLYITWFIYINTAFTNRTYRNRCILQRCTFLVPWIIIKT